MTFTLTFTLTYTLTYTMTFTLTFTFHLQIDGASSRSIERHFYIYEHTQSNASFVRSNSQRVVYTRSMIIGCPHYELQRGN